MAELGDEARVDGTQDSQHQQRVLEIPTLDNEEVPVVLDDLATDQRTLEDVTEVLVTERAQLTYWVRIIEELWRLAKWKDAIALLDKGIESKQNQPRERMTFHHMKANYLLALARRAPRLVLPQPRGGPLVRSTDPNHPESSNPNPSASPTTKDNYYMAVEQQLSLAAAIDPNHPVFKDVKGAFLLARGKFDEASRLFDAILAQEPTNVPALMGRARILFARRSFRPALKAYQSVLTLAPKSQPDPRIGIGLCFWMLSERDRARKAWERASVLNPKSPVPGLLLGLAHLNASKDPTLAGGEQARSEEYAKGIQFVSAAFKLDNTQAAAAGPLANHFLLTGKPGVIKLAERVIQFADARVLTSEGHLCLARALQASKDPGDMIEYRKAVELNPDQLLALLAQAQAFTRIEDYPAAVNTYETILRRNGRCIEALVSLAAIHTALAFSYRGVTDSAVERKKAKDLYDQVLRIFATGKEGQGPGKQVNKFIAKSERVREIARDPQMFIEIARLWADDSNMERSLRAYQEAERIMEEETDAGSPNAPLLNNIGVLLFQKGDYAGAQASFEEALTEVGNKIAEAGGNVSEENDAVLIPCTYNRGVTLEVQGDKQGAVESYQQIIGMHPEYVEAKARLALVAIASQGKGRWAELDRAHALIKETLTSQPKNPELRALYTYYLLESHSYKFAREFTLSTLRENKHDIYALCAAAMLLYTDARENRDTSKDGSRQRHRNYLRAAEYYAKALERDPHCAFAAQGLAIGIAENTLGAGVDASGNGGIALSNSQVMQKNTRDALTILSKVKESINEGSVYINIGHCHFLREEFDRAIENYEMASTRYFRKKSVSALLYLSRAWFHKAGKEQNFSDLQKSLESCKAAHDLQPHDLSTRWNVALVQQKGLEILIGLPESKRTVAELTTALADAEASQATFEELVNESPANPPYQKDFPTQRRNYGASIIKRAPAIIESQREYENTEEAKLLAAKKRRDDERQQQAELDALRREEQKRKDEALAEQRRAMREEAAQWALSQRFVDSDEDEGVKKKDKKGGGGAGGGAKKRTKKTKTEAEADGSGASDDDEVEKPTRKKKKAAAKPKKSRARKEQSVDSSENEMELDEDGEEAVRGGNKRKSRSGKVFKSTEFISDDSEDE